MDIERKKELWIRCVLIQIDRQSMNERAKYFDIPIAKYSKLCTKCSPVQLIKKKKGSNPSPAQTNRPIMTISRPGYIYAPYGS